MVCDLCRCNDTVVPESMINIYCSTISEMWKRPSSSSSSTFYIQHVRLALEASTGASRGDIYLHTSFTLHQLYMNLSKKSSKQEVANEACSDERDSRAI